MHRWGLGWLAEMKIPVQWHSVNFSCWWKGHWPPLTDEREIKQLDIIHRSMLITLPFVVSCKWRCCVNPSKRFNLRLKRNSPMSVRHCPCIIHLECVSAAIPVQHIFGCFYNTSICIGTTSVAGREASSRLKWFGAASGQPHSKEALLLRRGYAILPIDVRMDVFGAPIKSQTEHWEIW